jgi:hypothetical protein
VDELELKPDKNIKTAIIYSLDDLFTYIIKICYQENSYYIENGDQLEKFGNINEAKKACRKHNVEEAYLALSNSYQELDSTTDKLHDPMPRYDYQKIIL